MTTIHLNNTVFEIPYELDLLNCSLDNKAGTYRIALGYMYDSPDKEAYQSLFDAIDKTKVGIFINGVISFQEEDSFLKMTRVIVSKLIRPFGVFYELESAIVDSEIGKVIQYDHNRRSDISENKTTKRKRNITNKSN